MEFLPPPPSVHDPAMLSVCKCKGLGVFFARGRMSSAFPLHSFAIPCKASAKIRWSFCPPPPSVHDPALLFVCKCKGSGVFLPDTTEPLHLLYTELQREGGGTSSPNKNTFTVAHSKQGRVVNTRKGGGNGIRPLAKTLPNLYTCTQTEGKGREQ